MEEKWVNYFQGKLSETEKLKILSEAERDEKARKDFADLNNVWGVSQLLTQQQDTEIALKGNKRFLKRIRRKNIRFHITRLLRYAAVICLVSVSTWYLAMTYYDRMENPSTEICVPTGQRMLVTLADNSSIWLSPQSRIKFPNRFQRDNRTIELDGEGLFNIAEDKERPFIVKSKGYNIEVTGTTFNIFSYLKNPRYEVHLIEGSIQIYNDGNNRDKLLLSPDEKIALVDGELVKMTSSFENKGFVTNGIYYFNATPFIEILEHLSLWYDIEFEIKDQVLSTTKVNAKFRLTDDIESILAALQNVFRFNFQPLTEHKIEISP